MRFRFKETPSGCVGAIDMPSAAPGRVSVVASGNSKAEALARAALIAERIASDPVMSALLPPGALPAIKAAKVLASAANRGPHALRSLMRRIRGPGKLRLAEVLHVEATEADREVGWNPFRRKSKKKRAEAKRRRREEEPPEEEPEADAEAEPKEADRWKDEAMKRSESEPVGDDDVGDDDVGDDDDSLDYDDNSPDGNEGVDADADDGAVDKPAAGGE